MSIVYDKIKHSSGYELLGNYARIARCIDMHTGGEPLRVVMQGMPELKAGSILECRQKMQNDFDHFRKKIMWEPRGHADMYGVLLLPPEREDSDFGVLFMHNEGYSTMCGHAIIAIAKLTVLMNWVKKKEPLTELKIDAPCGQIKAYVEIENGMPQKVYFDNVPSFVQELDAVVHLPGGKKIIYDLAYGGAFYAYVNVGQVDLKLNPDNYQELILMGKTIKKSVMESKKMQHPFAPDLNFLYGTIFIEPSGSDDFHSKNVCIFADGEVDRSATGSGVSGRAAIHFARQEIKLNEQIGIRSIIGSEMQVEVKCQLDFGPYKAIVPRVYGNAWISGFHEFVMDREDPFSEGFFLR